jgi:hypothetical protein
MKIALSLLLGIQSVSATGLTVITPDALKKVINTEYGKTTGEIDSWLGNYGHISYGQKFIGDLYHPKSNREGCSPFVDGDFERPVDKSSSEDGANVMTAYPIILLNHGQCTLVSKTMNAQNFGFRAVIIATDNVNNEDFELLR